MHRLVIGIAVFAVVVVVAAVIAVAVVRMGDRAPSEPVGEPEPVVVDATPVEDGTEAPDTPAGPVTRPKLSRAPANDESQPAKETAEKPAGEKAATPAGEGRVAALVKQIGELNDNERRQLMGQIMRRGAQDRFEQRKYDLPSDRRLQRLERNRNEALRLTEAQQQQITTLREMYKPQLDAVLSDIWARQAEMRDQATALMRDGNREQAGELFGQMRELNQQADQARAPIEEQYKTALTGVLNAQQLETMAQESDRRGGDRGGRRRGGFGGGPGGGGGGG